MGDIKRGDNAFHREKSVCVDIIEAETRTFSCMNEKFKIGQNSKISLSSVEKEKKKKRGKWGTEKKIR